LRILKQMMRELLLAQSSDWPFILKTGTSPDYARKRVDDHLARFWWLDRLLAGGLDASGETTARLEAVEYADRIFPDCDPGVYAIDK